MEYVSLPLSPAPLDSTGTMEIAMPPAPSAAAPKEISARESALLVHGHTTMAATGPAPLNTPPMMLVLIPAPLELPSRTEFARLVPKAAPLDSSSMLPPHPARLASTPALSAP